MYTYRYAAIPLQVAYVYVAASCPESASHAGMGIHQRGVQSEGGAVDGGGII